MRLEIAAALSAAAFALSISTEFSAQEKKSPSAAQIQPAQEGLALEVRDARGAPVRNSTVAILSNATGKELRFTTNEDGQLRIADLAIGSYEITITADGFKELRILDAITPNRKIVTLEAGKDIIIADPADSPVPLESSSISTQMTRPSSTASISQQSSPTAEQTGFNYELEIDPVRKPILLPKDALQTLAKDNHIRSCLDSENLAPESLPARWFVASQVHLDGAKEVDLIVLPSGRLSDTPQGEISANACLVGAYTGGFWVMRQTSTGFELVLSEMAHGLEVLKTRTNGFRDIRLSTIMLSEHTIQDFSFDGSTYRLVQTRTTPNR